MFGKKVKVKEEFLENAKNRLNLSTETVYIYDSYRRDVSFLVNWANTTHNFVPKWEMLCMAEVEKRPYLVDEYSEETKMLIEELKYELKELSKVLFGTDSLF